MEPAARPRRSVSANTLIHAAAAFLVRGNVRLAIDDVIASKSRVAQELARRLHVMNAGASGDPLTEAHTHLRELNHVVDQLKKQYTAFVRTRQAATQSYEGYDDGIRRQRSLIREARTTVSELMARQGHMLETMAVNELTRRRERLSEFQIKARFAMADSYDRAVRDQTQERLSQ